MRILGIFLLTITIIIPAFINANAATINAASCSQTDVQAAIDSASRGDVVTIPAGSCTWSTKYEYVNAGIQSDYLVKTTKAITIQGAGSSNTTIKAGVTGSTMSMISYIPSSPSSDAETLFRVSGITFDMDRRAEGIQVANYSTTFIKKIRIDNNVFMNSLESRWTFYHNDVTIRIEGNVYGLIDSNTFIGTPFIDVCAWNGSTWNYRTYQNGTADAIYIEDNTFSITSWKGEWNSLFVAGHGAAVTFRYNSVTLNSSVGLWHDLFNIHGDKGIGGVYGAMGSEIYGNNVYLNANDYGGIFLIRGGRNKTFYNKTTITGIEYQWDRYEEEYCDYDYPALGDEPTNYTCPSETGILYAGHKCCASDGQPQHVHNTYDWANWKTLPSSGTTAIDFDYGYGSPDEGEHKALQISRFRNLFKFRPSFDGTEGTGCGTLASRPSTCTSGVGYWATEQSCSDLTGLVGANHTSDISGALYRCYPTNVWTAYYTPYAYPHPLRGESDGEAPSVSNVGPLTEQVCTTSPQSVAVSMTVTDANQGSTVCKWDLDNVPYASMGGANGGTFTPSGTTYTATVPDLPCGTTTPVYYACTDGTNTTATMVIPIAVAAYADTTGPVLTNRTSRYPAHTATQLVTVTSDEQCTMRYCVDGEGSPPCSSSTAWTARTQFTQTVDTVHHSLQLALAPSSTKTIHCMCRDAAGNDSANLAVTITTDGSKTLGTGSNTITFDGTNTLEMI